MLQQIVINLCFWRRPSDHCLSLGTNVIIAQRPETLLPFRSIWTRMDRLDDDNITGNIADFGGAGATVSGYTSVDHRPIAKDAGCF